ncbi:MAG: hypothetical protein V7K41_01945 [Nostoc sp.]|uniref:hypothetical protein n=1 Tax=Nostoc sp. TaxID=1180 RepID=UPI002FFC9DC9
MALAFLVINIWIYLLWHYLSTLRSSSKKAFSHLFTFKQMLEFLRQTIDGNYGEVHEMRLT